MSAIKLSTRYAKSLIDLSLEKGMLEDVYADIQFFRKTLKENRELHNVLKSPVIKEDKKKNILLNIFEEAFNELTLIFFKVVLSKTREAFLSDIADAFVIQYQNYKNIVSAKIVTASPISDELRADIEEMVKNQTNADSIQLVNMVDKDIIGGFVLKYEDKLYDASVSNKLEELKKEFSNKEYIKQY